MATKLALLLTFLSIYVLAPEGAHGTNGFPVMSLNLGLTNQSGWWVWFNSSDSPEGAFLGTITESQQEVTGTVPLGRTIAPGRYYLSLKAFDYGASGSATLSAGGGSTTVTDLGLRDSYGWWTAPAAIDVADATSAIQMTFHRSMASGIRQLYLLRGLYITRSATEEVLGDSVFDRGHPVAVDSNAVRKGNLLDNSSFEVGIGHGWGMDEGGPRGLLAPIWSDRGGFHGDASIKVPNLKELVSRTFRVRGSREHTCSAWIKAAVGGNIKLTVHAVGGVPSNYPAPVLISQVFPVGTAWQRVSVSGILWDYPTGDYQIRIKANDPQGGFVWVDAVQVEEDAVTRYDPKQQVEVGLVSDMPNNLFFEDEPVAMRLLAHNGTATARPTVIPYEIHDHLNHRVVTGSTNIVVPPLGTWQGTLNLSPGRRGFFRVSLWVDGLDHTHEEVAFAVLARPQRMAANTDSLIGIHADFSDFQFAALQKLGIKWNRASSPSRAFRWTAVEPSPGSFVWGSDDMDLAHSYGITVLGTLGLEWPSWADVDGVPNLDRWESFVAAVVARYRDDVKYWEVWNEPNWQVTPQFYGQMLERASRAILNADPQAKIIGLGGVATLSWATNALNSFSNAVSSLHAVSTHLYPTAQASEFKAFRTSIQDAYGLPVWNTEAGIWDRGSYLGENSNFLQADGYIWPQGASERYQIGAVRAPEMLSQNFLRNIGEGLGTFFYYDARIYIGPGMHGSHSTIFESDDSIRPKGVAYSVLAKLFDGSAGLGDVSSSPSSAMYLFDRNGTPLLALWSIDRANRNLTLNPGGASLVLYDLMGNPTTVTNGVVPYGRAPVYVESPGASVDVFRGVVTNGGISLRADTAPPNISIVAFPTGPTRDNPVKLRWLALDETSFPSGTSPNAIHYSYMLDGYENEWSPWSAASFVDYFNVPPGTYEFRVKAKDEAGNIANQFIQVVVDDPRPGRPTNLRILSGNP